MKYTINVEYDGFFPTLCFGKWNIIINNHKLKVENDNFNTYGEYRKFVCQEPTKYTDGLKEDEWIKELKKNNTNNLYSELCKYFTNEEIDELLPTLFYMIQSKDWRSGSCGGCV